MFSLGEPALGALLAAGGIPSTRVVLLGLLAAAAGYSCIYALNDLLDLKSDREEIRLASAQPMSWDPEVKHIDITSLRHPVAAGALPLWAAVSWVVALGIIGLVAAYLLRPLCAYLFVVCALLQVLYCSLRKKTWLKIIPAGVMVGVGGLAGWFAVGEADRGAAAFFLLLVLWEIAGRNLSNDLADVSHDRVVGIATLAATHGTRVTGRVILIGAAVMPALSLLQDAGWVARVLIAAVAIVTMTWPAVYLERDPRESPAQRYFNRASLFPTGAALALILLAVANLVRNA